MQFTTEPTRDELWRKFDFLSKSLASAGKSQARFVAALLTYFALLWGWYYTSLNDFKVSVLGVEINAEGLLAITPALLTVLVLALIGSMNIMGPIWKRMRDCCSELGIDVFWTDTDPNKTLIDFFAYLKIRPEGPVEPVKPSDVQRHKYRISVFSYPAVIGFAIYTTLQVDSATASRSFRIYVYLCAASQFLYSFRVWYRAVCRFLGVRKLETEI